MSIVVGLVGRVSAAGTTVVVAGSTIAVAPAKNCSNSVLPEVVVVEVAVEASMTGFTLM